ncbi:unnamed protein product [Psylliodes chrysocephalus]|uniref:Chromatin assembly factor 1 subunit A dimerization domain-containing protein n=1 Tax=Psylliodes chrysocephalus TaxID=3402493 RepID=A0A9P0CZP9_9CUCU|nr:unnamed protein product [Psylliodes chrysocephala]
METDPKEMPVSRKRRPRSKSPSEDNAEQNLKKKRLDNGEEISLNEITNEQASLQETSVNGSIYVKNDSASVIKGETEPLGKLESKFCSNETKTRTNNENKMEIFTQQKEISETGTINDIECNNTDDKTLINISEEKSPEKSDQFNKIEGTTQGLVENKKCEENIVLESEEKRAEDKISEALILSSDTDEDTTFDKEKLLKTLDHTPTKKLNPETPNKKLTPKQMQKKLEAEKRNQEKQKDKEERMKKKLEEKERITQEKLKKKEMKEKEIELKKKERDEKEEKKRKEREEKEQKRKEKEEMEEQKRKEREQEKQKKLQEIEEKNMEKLKEEEKKQKAVAAFVNFFVPKKSEETQRVQTSNFLEFEVKSDMKLPLPRRETMSTKEKETLEYLIQNQNEKASYLKDLSSGKVIGKSLKTWPYKETIDDDVLLVDLGETICEDKSSLQRHRAKFLYFHENRRPAYYGTWRKESKFVLPRKPFGEDKKLLNYEEDSDDDWEEEEQGESLNGSEDEADKEIEDEKDDYEVDNEFFVPHGHLSDDEVDDEEMARLSPDSLKQKLKLLKEEFDQDMKLKTLKLKPRSIGCIWYNKEGTNVEDPVNKYLQPLAIITRHTQIIIKSRIDIASLVKEKRNKVIKELDPELIPSLLKIIHGSSKKKSMLVEQFLAENELNVSKGSLMRQLKQCAVWEKYKDLETKRYKFRWIVHQELREKYNLI